MDIIIKINDEYELEALTTIAGNNKLSTEQYATNIVRGWVQSQLKGLYVNYVKTNSLENVRTKIGILKVKEVI